jgi:hypothetical protein
VRISVQGEKEGGFKLASKASNLGRLIGFARGPKMWEGPEGVEVPVLIARRCVEVARPPSEASWVRNWETEFGRDGREVVRGRLIDGV